MSVHQIIYTSCMRGINGVNDGQQVFSYDAQFEDSNNDDIKSLFSYQPPALDSGVIMTEEIAKTLPSAFIYRKLENGTCALTLNTYLGRDYMGSAGRFGNHLSHVVVADEKEFSVYPCEFYGSTLLRDHMEYEEVNNPNQPDYLSIPVLEKGYVVDVAAVLEFLSINGRLEIYKNMLYAMLAFERERKRVVICDKAENIVMWIGALEYAIPLKTALDINFTTYEFDPSLSASQICGVVKKGTRYTSESKRQHFVFDMYQNDCVEFEKDTDFYDFIDMAFSLSYDSIQDFHNFLIEGYCYEKADEEIYSAYVLYSLLSDGISVITKNRLEAALQFAQKYATDKETNRIIKNLLSQYNELLCVDKWVFLNIIRYVASKKMTINTSEYLALKNMIIERVLCEFISENINEDIFVTFYDNISHICVQCGICLTDELLQDGSRTKLLTVMQNNIEIWKIAFIVRVISTYVKEKHISITELTQGKLLGQIYYEIIMTVYLKSVQNGFFLVRCILDEFSDNCSCLVNMSLNIEGMLLDLPNGEEKTETLWQYFGEKIISEQSEYFDIVYNIFFQYKRYELIFMVFDLELQNTLDVTACRMVFDKHFNKFVKKNDIYANMYKQSILLIYFDRLKDLNKNHTKEAKLELFDLLVNEKINTNFSGELIKDLLGSMPLQNPSKQNERFIQNAFDYTYNFRKQPITGKLLLLFIGVVMGNINNCKEVKEKINQLEILTKHEKADLEKVSERALYDYFAWVLPVACKYCQKNEYMTMFYNLFDMSMRIEKVFYLECTKIYLGQCKDKKDYEVFAEYFSFVCEHADIQIRQEIGKTLCKLNKNKMAELDETIRHIYHANNQFIEYWCDIKNIAESTNPLLNNISSLLKKGTKLWKSSEK